MIIPVLKRSKKLGIDKRTESIKSMIDKLKEESGEVEKAYLEESSWSELAGEIMDIIQVCIGLLWRLDKEKLIDIKKTIKDHWRKLMQDRDWEIETVLKVKGYEQN